MKYRVLTTHDSGEWHDILERVPESDVYFLPEYHRVYELNGEGMARAFVAWEGDDLLFYPFLVRPIEKIGHESIPQSYYDIETVYGYSGPLATNNNPEFLERAWKSFSVWCANEHVVAEFIRFHPSTGCQREGGPLPRQLPRRMSPHDQAHTRRILSRARRSVANSASLPFQ